MFTATAIGRLVKDPTLEESPTGTPICKFRIACDKARGKKGANFIDVVVWPGAKDNHKHLTKGRQVAVTGNIDHQQWKKDESWNERYELIADQVIWMALPRDTEPTEAPTETPEPAMAGAPEGEAF